MKPQQPIVRVSEVMKSEVDIIDGMLTVAAALKNMQHLDTRTFVVDKRHPDDEYGVVMFRDIAKRVLAPNLSPERINVYEIMSKPVLPVEPDMDVRYVARMFDHFGLSIAPVLENGQVIGVVSYEELVFDGLCALED